MAHQSAIVEDSSLKHVGLAISDTSPWKLPANNCATTCLIGFELYVRGMARIGTKSVGTYPSPCASCTIFLRAAASSSPTSPPSRSTRHATGAISQGGGAWMSSLVSPANRRSLALDLASRACNSSDPLVLKGTITSKQSSTSPHCRSVFSTSHTHTWPRAPPYERRTPPGMRRGEASAVETLLPLSGEVSSASDEGINSC
eukprot:scaffold257999_cov32-Tisochrysis_lutea.AAC.1